jgi:hypothetical protein
MVVGQSQLPAGHLAILGIELFLKVHLLQAPALVFLFFHARHHQHLHAAIFGSPLVKRCRTDAQLSVNVGHRIPRLDTFDRIQSKCQARAW